MSSETKVPALPKVPDDATPGTIGFLKAVKELLEVREGQRGQALDQFVTVRDLQGAGVVTYKPGGKGKPGTITPGGTDQDFTTPPALTGFTVSGGYAQIFIEWNRVSYPSFSHVELWRSATDALGAAAMIGVTTASVYSDACGTNKHYYYWGRAVSKAGVKGPFNAVHGTFGETSPDIAYLLEQLSGAITESQLYQDLGARIALIDSPDTVLNSVNARVKALRESTDGHIAQVNERLTVVESVDQDLITAINQIVVVDRNQASEIYLEQIARITTDNAQAQQILTLSASVSSNQAALQSEQTARATAETALTRSIETAVSRIATAEASIVAQYDTLAAADHAQVTGINQIVARLNNIGGISLEQKFTATASALDGLSAQYTVKVDVNGYVSGFGLSTTARDATPESEFYVRADRFAVGSPNKDKIIPFIVQASATTLNGEAVPAGVYMNTAFIKNGSLTSAKIGDLNADKITAGKMSGERITAGTLDADRIITTTLSAQLAQITDAYITSANIGDAEVGTLKLAGESVTVPRSQVLASNVTGAGYHIVFDTTIVMPVACKAFLTIYWNESFNSTDVTGTRTYMYVRRVTTGDVEVSTAERQPVTTWSSFSHADIIDLAAGANRIYVYWLPADGNQTMLSGAVMSILGVAR